MRGPNDFTAYYVDEEGTLVSLNEMGEMEDRVEEVTGLAE